MTTMTDERTSEHPDLEWDGGEPTDAMKALADDAYAQISELTLDQKHILIGTTLQKALAVLSEDNGHGGVDGSNVAIGMGLLGIAGYTNETIRNDNGFTSTGDKAVDKVIATYRDLLRETALANMDEDQRAMAEEAQRRVQAGEDPISVVREVTGNPSFTPRGRAEEPTGPTSEPEPSYGLYL